MGFSSHYRLCDLFQYSHTPSTAWLIHTALIHIMISQDVDVTSVESVRSLKNMIEYMVRLLRLANLCFMKQLIAMKTRKDAAIGPIETSRSGESFTPPEVIAVLAWQPTALLTGVVTIISEERHETPALAPNVATGKDMRGRYWFPVVKLAQPGDAVTTLSDPKPPPKPKPKPKPGPKLSTFGPSVTLTSSPIPSFPIVFMTTLKYASLGSVSIFVQKLIARSAMSVDGIGGGILVF